MDSWLRLFETLGGIFYWFAVGVFMFAGATWMLGNRSKAIELMIGGSLGFLVINHARDIVEFLKTL
jgi:hypothetical protein